MSTITDVSRGSTYAVDQTSPTTAEAAVGKTHPGNIVCCTDTSWAALTAVQIHQGAAQYALHICFGAAQAAMEWICPEALGLVQDRHVQR